MIALRCNWLAPLMFFICVFCLISRPSRAQDFPIGKFESYRALRSALIEQGWKPDTNYGLKVASGKPMYHFPEVVCGPRLCNAKWHERNGKEMSVKLLRGFGGDDHRVAPQ